jgi:hypothetical protein
MTRVESQRAMIGQLFDQTTLTTKRQKNRNFCLLREPNRHTLPNLSPTPPILFNGTQSRVSWMTNPTPNRTIQQRNCGFRRSSTNGRLGNEWSSGLSTRSSRLHSQARTLSGRSHRITLIPHVRKNGCLRLHAFLSRRAIRPNRAIRTSSRQTSPGQFASPPE